MRKLTKSIVDSTLPRMTQYTVWCGELKGFGVFIHPSGTRTYFVDYRNSSNVRRRMTIGRHGPITTEQARKLALATLGEIVRGEDPADERATQRKSLTVRELCQQYLAAADKGLIFGKGNKPKKANTLYIDRGRIKRHILPLLGETRVKDLTSVDVNRFIRNVASGKTALVEKTQQKRGKSVVRGGLGTAARTTGLLGGILSFAVSEGIITLNPAQGVKRPSYNRRRRRLSENEYERLGFALDRSAIEGELEQALQGVRLLALTGCRLGEIVKLTWNEVDHIGKCFRLEDSKEGASIRPIGATAFAILAKVQRQDDCPFVLRPARKAKLFGGMRGAWRRIAKRAELEDVTPHTLRHSFASVAADLGYSEPTIAAMLGHSAGSMTSRYIHSLDAVLVAAANQVAETINCSLSGTSHHRR